ncbi:hypothetical protein TRFO_09547 [Tritrichomonas foetus]|uniref:Initiator binding domain-containing protein n=1 Tax=Tritrichomonas foetus TaxID=1144522 RepID=A0A1J4JDJ7_9EUKA|nr:hypothetical protein TRFO_09547 [Tritrichomonas foetus]|eukprot:OHS97270.1 hypothetical protein TRFO_09547 [Tritrichomonas foetus]
MEDLILQQKTPASVNTLDIYSLFTPDYRVKFLNEKDLINHISPSPSDHLTSPNPQQHQLLSPLRDKTQNDLPYPVSLEYLLHKPDSSPPPPKTPLVHSEPQSSFKISPAEFSIHVDNSQNHGQCSVLRNSCDDINHFTNSCPSKYLNKIQRASSPQNYHENCNSPELHHELNTSNSYQSIPSFASQSREIKRNLSLESMESDSKSPNDFSFQRNYGDSQAFCENSNKIPMPQLKQLQSLPQLHIAPQIQQPITNENQMQMESNSQINQNPTNGKNVNQNGNMMNINNYIILPNVNRYNSEQIEMIASTNNNNMNGAPFENDKYNKPKKTTLSSTFVPRKMNTITPNFDMQHFSLCCDPDLTINPQKIGFIPKSYWENISHPIGVIIRDFFFRKNHPCCRFYHKLYNALKLSEEKPEWQEFIGAKWLNNEIMQINGPVFGKLLGIRSYDGSLFHQQGNFPSFGFVELDIQTLQTLFSNDYINKYLTPDHHFLIHKNRAFRRDSEEEDFKYGTCKWVGIRQRSAKSA